MKSKPSIIAPDSQGYRKIVVMTMLRRSEWPTTHPPNVLGLDCGDMAYSRDLDDSNENRD